MCASLGGEWGAERAQYVLQRLGDQFVGLLAGGFSDRMPGSDFHGNA